MLTDLLTILFLSAIPAAFNYFLDYTVGKPMSKEPSTGAIFSGYSIFLARRRLEKLALMNGLIKAFSQQLNSDNQATRLDGKEQLELAILLTAQKYFVYEQALGMCPFCTNFWASVLAAFIMFFNVDFQVIDPICLFLLIPIFSHTILRKL